MDRIIYTNGEIFVSPVRGATSLVYKSPGANPVTVSLTGGAFVVAAGPQPGTMFLQFINAGVVVQEMRYEVRQDLAHATSTTDMRTLAERTLEALDDKIAGRALSITQSKITVGDRSIEYINSIDELLKWRSYYAGLVAREQGHGKLTAEVSILRRG